MADTKPGAEKQGPETTDEQFMRRALTLAKEAGDQGEVPVGALVVLDGEVIGEGRNHPIIGCDPTAHAEVAAIRHAAATIDNYRMPGATLYVTIEPCTMCVGAIVHARIDRVVFGAREPKAGAVVSQNSLLEHAAMNYRVGYAEGVLADECRRQMSDFFARRRAEKKALKDSDGAPGERSD